MKLDHSIIFKRFKKDLTKQYGREKAVAIWQDAADELQRLEAADKNAPKNDRSFVFSAVALYRAVERHAPGEALPVTRDYGTKTGIRFRDLFRRITALPGMPSLMWKKMPTIAKKMTEGYEYENLIVTEHLCSLNVTGCPMYDSARKLGAPEAAQMICCMDKEYMTGFRGVKYTRTKSLAEGDAYCDYLLEDIRKR